VACHRRGTIPFEKTRDHNIARDNRDCCCLVVFKLALWIINPSFAHLSRRLTNQLPRLVCQHHELNRLSQALRALTGYRGLPNLTTGRTLFKAIHFCLTRTDNNQDRCLHPHHEIVFIRAPAPIRPLACRSINRCDSAIGACRKDQITINRWM